jgi:hypothetical protein
MTWLTIPPDKATGCLPRASKPGEWCPMLAERIAVIDSREWDGILAEREKAGESLKGRNDVRKIKDQDGIGSCATESTAQAIEVTMVRAGQPWEELNPWSIYRVTSDGRDAGSNIDRNLQFARDVGVLPVTFFPRYDPAGKIINRWNARPPAGWEEIASQYRIDEWYDCTTTAEIGTALLLNFAVVIGWSSHSELLVDLLPGQKAMVANSWGTSWGDAGFHVEPLARVNFAYGAFAVRTNRERQAA